MIEREGWPVGVGNSFELEVAIMEASCDATPQASHTEEIAELVNELSDANPYVGHELVIYTREPLKLISLKDGSYRHISTEDGLVATLEGFHAETDMTSEIVHSELGVEFSFDHPDLAEFIGHTTAENIVYVELNDSTHPFVYEQKMMASCMEKFQNVLSLYPAADLEDYAEGLTGDLEARSLLIDAEVEILIGEITEIGLRKEELLPYWAEPDEEDLEDVDFDEYMMTVDFRGKFIGKVVGYENILEEEDVPSLCVILALNPDNNITDDTSVRYAYVNLSSISWGRVLSGPSFN